MDKTKHWVYTIKFTTAEGTVSQQDFVESAEDTSILLLTGAANKPLPQTFPFEPFREKFTEKFDEVEGSIKVLSNHGTLAPNEKAEWDTFFTAAKSNEAATGILFHLELPGSQSGKPSRHGHFQQVRVDDCVRDVDVVQHAQFTASDR